MSGPDMERFPRGLSRATSRTSVSAPSRMCSSSLVLNPFDFTSKTLHGADEALIINRSANFRCRPNLEDDDVWHRSAPDFRPQVYNPKPPKRNSREAMQPWKYGTLSEETPPKRKAEVKLPHILQPQAQEEAEPFLTAFKILDPLGSKMLFCKEGMYPADVYKMPKPHDFRGYPPIESLGLSEFETAYEHDPYNLNFKGQRLDIIRGLHGTAPTERLITGRQMAPPLPVQPQWEARLILPQDPYPRRFAGYTRYRPTNRSPHSALLTRIQESLDTKWAKEKLDTKLTSTANCLPKSRTIKDKVNTEDKENISQDDAYSQDTEDQCV